LTLSINIVSHNSLIPIGFHGELPRPTHSLRSLLEDGGLVLVFSQTTTDTSQLICGIFTVFFRGVSMNLGYILE